MTKISDQEFITLWRKMGSPTEISKTLGISIRSIQSRRRTIEGRFGISLLLANSNSSDLVVTIPSNRVRITADLNDGIVLIGSDAHYWPGLISTAHRAFIIAARELRPKMIVMNGDVFDGATVSRHDRIAWENRPTVKQELDAAVDRLSEIEAVAANAKLHWTWGNHDMRFNSRLSVRAGEYEGVKGFNLTNHFLRWTFSTSLMVNESVMIKHRWHNGVHATWNNTLKAGTSMVTGHLHALQIRPYTDYNGTRYAVDTGTLACPTGEQFTYSEDSPANHRSGFAVLTFRDGRLLPPELVEVIDEDQGLVHFRGQVVKV